MLAGVVVLWALNVTLSKYVLEHGFQPLAYSALRYGTASIVFVGLARSVRLTRRQAYGVAVTWGAYSIAISVLMRDYSPIRISAVVLPLMAIPIALTAIPQFGRMDYGAVRPWTWVVFSIAVIGPLVITNLLWFRALDEV